MSGLTVRLYEEYLADVYKNRKADQGLFIKLVEEIGEVAEQLNHTSSPLPFPPISITIELTRKRSFPYAQKSCSWL